LINATKSAITGREWPKAEVAMPILQRLLPIFQPQHRPPASLRIQLLAADMLVVYTIRIKAGFADKIKANEMKVKTDIHAGNVIDDASQAADQIYNQVAGFVSSANQQAEEIKNKGYQLSSQLWSSASDLFSTG
jgi:hypothetical protein